MPNQADEQSAGRSVWQAKQVYTAAVICMLTGLATGYLFRGSQSPALAAQPVANAKPFTPAKTLGGHTPSLDDMKHMADMKAAPLLEKLEADPRNSDQLIKIGNIYKATHQFNAAAVYYDKALQVDPKNVTIRSELASCLYYQGDVDGAISQLQQGLNFDPKNANSLFNLGLIKWQGKQDSKGALAVWQQLLRSNPQLSADRKITVQKLIARVETKGKS